jgi:hypothetical protein
MKESSYPSSQLESRSQGVLFLEASPVEAHDVRRLAALGIAYLKGLPSLFLCDSGVKPLPCEDALQQSLDSADGSEDIYIYSLIRALKRITRVNKLQE